MKGSLAVGLAVKAQGEAYLDARGIAEKNKENTSACGTARSVKGLRGAIVFHIEHTGMEHHYNESKTKECDNEKQNLLGIGNNCL